MGRRRASIRNRLDHRAGSGYPALVDAVAGLLDGPRARDAFLLRSLLDPPFALRIRDEAPLTLVAVVRGAAWLLPDGGSPVALQAGDTAILRGPEPYTVADHPSTPPSVVIEPGQRCTTPDGVELTGMSDQGVRTWGNSAVGSTVLLTGTYQAPAATSRRLLDALPPLLTCGVDELGSPLVDYLAAEIARDQPGQEAVLDRLLDLLLVAVLRTWFARPEARAPGWYSAHGDPVVGPALRLMHHDPARPWTVAALAREAGVSRAVLARRFTELVGEPPMAFLTGWRLTLAADLLREPGATLGAVAHRVGYASPFALSTAFKRVRGVSPREYRAAATSVTSSVTAAATSSATGSATSSATSSATGSAAPAREAARA
jgi:AraC-like DNA-binding protein